MNLTKIQIQDLSAMQICSRLTRLQFDEEADGISASEKKEAVKLEKELRKRLARALKGGEPMKTRKAYKKPEIKKVPLRPEEAVLGFCKTSQSRGPRFGTCNRPGMCFTEGS